MTDLTLSQLELEEITGGYKRPGDQLRELQRQGFHRARRSRITGEVILERAHYDAVCAGAIAGQSIAPHGRPTLRAVT